VAIEQEVLPDVVFPPSERKGGSVFDSREQLVAVVAGAGVGLVVIGSRGPRLSSLLVAIGVFALAGWSAFFRRWGGLTPAEWVPIVSRYALRRAGGAATWHAPVDATSEVADAATHAVGLLAGLEFFNHDGIGVVRDRRAGTYGAVVEVREIPFGLMDADDQVRHHDYWGAFLEGLGSEGQDLDMLQAVEESGPADEVDAYAWLNERAALPEDHEAHRDYRELLDRAAPAARRRRGYVTVQIKARALARQIHASGGGVAGACRALVTEVRAASDALRDAGLDVVSVLSAQGIAAVVRCAVDPPAVRLLRLGDVPAAEAGPQAWHDGWRIYRTDGAWHITGLIKEYPREPRGIDFLAPLVLRRGIHRRIAFCFRPIPEEEATDQLFVSGVRADAEEQAATSMGLSATPRKRLAREARKRHEKEAARGAAFHRFGGAVTVTGTSPEEAEEHFAALCRIAARNKMQVRRMWGQQEVGFRMTLPLGGRS
jgi:type VII ESX secretion system EccE translocon-like protein